MNKLAVAPENQRLMSLIYFAFFNSGMMSILLGSLIPYMRESYTLSFVESGLMLSFHQVGNVCALFLVGFLPYVIGRKKTAVVLGSFLIVGLMLVTLTGNVPVLLFAFAATGISRGTMGNICNSSASQYAGNRTGALNLLHAAFAIGALTGPVMLLLTAGIPGAGWRITPWIVSALGLIVFALLAFSTLPSTPTPRPPKDSAPFFRSLPFWFNAGILFCYIGAESTIIGWFVTYFTETGRLSESVSTLTPSLLWLMVLVGRLICAGISDKFNKNRLLFVIGVLFTAFFALMLFTTGPFLCIISLMGIGISMAGIYPTTMGTTPNASSTVVTGTLASIACLGGILMPGIVGALAETRGMMAGVSAVLVLLACMVVLMAVKLFVRNSR